jgi:hypothetical protein
LGRLDSLMREHATRESHTPAVGNGCGPESNHGCTGAPRYNTVMTADPPRQDDDPPRDLSAHWVSPAVSRGEDPQSEVKFLKRINRSQGARGAVEIGREAVRSITGTHCPFTGWWESSQPASIKVVYFWKGAIMPGLDGQRVEWCLAKADPGGLLHAHMPVPDWATEPVPDMPLWPDCRY